MSGYGYVFGAGEWLNKRQSNVCLEGVDEE